MDPFQPASVALKCKTCGHLDLYSHGNTRKTTKKCTKGNSCGGMMVWDGVNRKQNNNLQQFQFKSSAPKPLTKKKGYNQNNNNNNNNYKKNKGPPPKKKLPSNPPKKALPKKPYQR